MKALDKTFQIVDALAELGPCRLGTVADRTDLPPSTVHHHLSALETHGFVVNARGTYRLALRFLDVGERVRRRRELFETARSEIDELADRIDRPVGLFVHEHGCAVLLYARGENPSIPVTLYAGQHLPLHATAPGKALMSASDRLHGERGRSGELRSFTEQTVTDRETLASELRVVADRGYATAVEERWPGRCGIAVPFTPGGEDAVAVIETALTPEQFRETDRAELVAELSRTASVVEIKSDYST